MDTVEYDRGLEVQLRLRLSLANIITLYDTLMAAVQIRVGPAYINDQ